MNPEQPINQFLAQSKHLRIIITTGLALMLFAIVGVYIYFGMQLAKNKDEIGAEVVEPEIGNRMQEIANSLERVPVASPDRMQAVEESLSRVEPA
jgi:hypothetical protein